jgi:hypothetical protein
MKSLKDRLAAAVLVLENENYHTEAGLMDEAIAALPDPPAFGDTALIQVLATLIRDNNLHTTNREDTMGVLLRCGASWAMPDEKKRDAFIVALGIAIDNVTIPFTTNDHGCAHKLTFGELAVGDRFVCWPIPGDNDGHGGFKGSNRLFTKSMYVNASMPHSGEALNGSGISSTFPHTMNVIKVFLT